MTANNLIYGEDIMEVIPYSNWREFTEKFKSFNNEKKNSLFRGQSNFYSDGDKKVPKHYGLKTTLQRHCDGGGYMDIRNTLDFILERKDKYKCLSELNIEDMENHLPLILYLRHAGVPMPVLDLTFNPITALYFSVHGLGNSYGVQDCIDENDKRHVSIYEFDKSLLIEYYDAKEFSELKYSTFGTHEKILFITETEKLSYPNNNMIKQDGAFIYFDSGTTIEAHIINLMYRKNLPHPIKHHQIPYKSILVDNIFTSAEENLFTYLASKKKVGFELFEDEQALLFDFINSECLEHSKK